MAQDYQWAQALRKAQMNAKKQAPTPQIFKSEPKVTLEQLEEQMAYYKNKLTEAAAKKNIPETKDLVARLINNHARQTALLVRKQKMLGSKDNGPEITGLLKKYFSDCKKLTEVFSS